MCSLNCGPKDHSCQPSSPHESNLEDLRFRDSSSKLLRTVALPITESRHICPGIIVMAKMISFIVGMRKVVCHPAVDALDSHTN